MTGEGAPPRRQRRFRPFADEATVLRLGGLTLEIRLDRVTVHGGLDLTRDQAGLALACDLATALAAVVAKLEAEGAALPERLPPPEPTTRVPNPFGDG